MKKMIVLAALMLALTTAVGVAAPAPAPCGPFPPCYPCGGGPLT